MGSRFPEVVRFVKRLKRGVSLDRVILFGSRARGDWLLDSDVDLVIVSPDFEGRPFNERVGEVLRSWKGRVNLDPICLTPREFSERSRRITIVREALRTGIRLRT